MRRSGELWRFLKFLLVGASGVVVNEGLYFLLTRYAGLPDTIALAIAIETSVISNFIFNEFLRLLTVVQGERERYSAVS